MESGKLRENLHVPPSFRPCDVLGCGPFSLTLLRLFLSRSCLSILVFFSSSTTLSFCPIFYRSALQQGFNAAFPRRPPKFPGLPFFSPHANLFFLEAAPRASRRWRGLLRPACFWGFMSKARKDAPPQRSTTLFLFEHFLYLLPLFDFPRRIN